MKHLYFISYACTKKTDTSISQAWGQCEVKLQDKLGEGEFDKLSKALEEEYNYTQVTITSIFYAGEVE